MVAYSFKKQFAYPVEKGYKLQTIRASRKTRHARPGESIQLYTGMRTKQCRKLVRADPIVKAVFRVDIFSPLDIRIDGQQLTLEQIRRLALADGFTDTIPRLGETGATVNAETHMIDFFKPSMPCEDYALIYWGPENWWSLLCYLPQLVIDNHDRRLHLAND